jgi:hypothetical protein
MHNLRAILKMVRKLVISQNRESVEKLGGY